MILLFEQGRVIKGVSGSLTGILGLDGRTQENLKVNSGTWKTHTHENIQDPGTLPVIPVVPLYHYISPFAQKEFTQILHILVDNKCNLSAKIEQLQIYFVHFKYMAANVV